MADDSNKPRLRSELAPAVGILTCLGAFAAAAIGAPMVLGQTSADEHAADGHGPVTTRIVVATGATKHFGRYEVVTSQDKDGRPCLGVRLLDPAPDRPTLIEGCGELTRNQIGSLSSKQGTLFFGQVSDQAGSAQIAGKNGRLKAAIQPFRGGDGGKYVLSETDEPLPESDITLVDTGGESLGRVDPEAVEQE